MFLRFIDGYGDEVILNTDRVSSVSKQGEYIGIEVDDGERSFIDTTMSVSPAVWQRFCEMAEDLRQVKED